MNTHEQFADDLALHALGSLRGNDLDALQKHMNQCASCRRELDSLRGDMALMALSAAGPHPPRRARQRLIDAVAREPHSRAAAARRRRWIPIPWLAAAALAVLAGFFWRENSILRQKLAGLQNQSAQQIAELERAREVVHTLTATDAMRVTLVSAKTPPQPQGKAFYLRDRSSLVFLASNMPPLPRNKAYELWLIPVSGAPIPAGVFKPDAHGNATLVNPPLPANIEAKAFAITAEPEQGSTVPTPPILMVGAGE